MEVFLNDKQVGGVASLIIMMVNFLGGIWFDVGMMGEGIQMIIKSLPFIHSVELTRLILAGNFEGILSHLLWIFGYSFVIFAIAVWVFKQKMKQD